MPYRLPDDYIRNTATVQLDDHRKGPDAPVWQPDVLPRAVELARGLGASTIVDVGCGNGRRLSEFAGEFSVIGIDDPSVTDRIDAPGKWIGHNLDRRVQLPVDTDTLSESVIVCADVIEHMHHPERLRNAIAKALDFAPVGVLSTPERELVRGVDHLGPPPNTAHAQEWTMDEFVDFLSEKMSVDRAVLTRQRNTSDVLHTVMVEVSCL